MAKTVPLAADLETACSLDLPPLAWHAHIRDGVVRVEHGARVEVGPAWIVEGVWDGPFAQGGFHRAEAFWGSGLRITAESIEIVPSTSLTDRLLHTRLDDGWAVSNSLPLLLGRNNLRLSDSTTYIPETFAVGSKGVFAYDSAMPVSGTTEVVHQLFHLNLVLKGSAERRVPRSRIWDFDAFSDYLEAVQAAVNRLATNIHSSDRRHPMVPLATVSSGYDSACVATFAKQAGARRALTAERSNSDIPRFVDRGASADSGSPVADALGLEVVPLPGEPGPREIYYRAAGCVRPDLALAGVGDHLHGSVGAVFTGFFGDTVWGLKDEANTDLLWSGLSGLSAAEGRLEGGYVNVALPFLFGRSRPSITRISQSAEMTPWRVGGSYDRPIPRRILEENGVPRQAFGIRKRATISSRFLPLDPELRRSYLQWVHQTAGVRPLTYRIRERLSYAAFLAVAAFQLVARRLRWHGQRTTPEKLWPETLQPASLMFRWAVETLRQHGEPPGRGQARNDRTSMMS